MAAKLYAAPRIDNERLTVWDVPLVAGVSGPVTSNHEDTVILFLEGGQIRTVVAFRFDSIQSIRTPGGASHLNPVMAGDIRFLRRGLTHSEGLTTDRQSAVYLELK